MLYFAYGMIQVLGYSTWCTATIECEKAGKNENDKLANNMAQQFTMMMVSCTKNEKLIVSLTNFFLLS